MIDSHCHLLHTFAPETLADEFAKFPASLSRLIDISTAEKDYLTVRSLELPASAAFAYGLYPDLAADFSPAMLERFAGVIDRLPPAAIGECGIDYHWDYGGFDVQQGLFRAQIELAASRGLPLVVHSRDAFDDTYRVLRETHPASPVIIHCFGYGRPEAERFLEMGFFISFAGNLTYKNAHGLHEAAAAVPLDRVLFETDSPYLTPVPHRGETNSPANVEYVYRYFAELRGLEMETLEKRVDENFSRAFGIKI